MFVSLIIIVKRGRHLKVIKKFVVNMKIGGIAYIFLAGREKKNSCVVDLLYYIATTFKILWQAQDYTY